MNGTLNQSTVVKEYEIIILDTDELDYLLGTNIKSCRKKIFFHLKIDVFINLNLKT